MLIGFETSITNAVLQATADSSLEVSRDDIEYEKINYEEFSPKEIESPDESEVNNFVFYKVTVHTADRTIDGFGIRDKTATYGRPVTAELHD